MRLLSVCVEGFMPYRERQTLDLRNKSIFALVGPTGSGKSALLDAITFAFYGKTPRWADGRPGKELISQGRRQLTVEVQFEVKGTTYQLLRSVRRGSGSPDVQLRHLVDGEFKALNVERRTATQWGPEIEKLLGMSYPTFTKTLMLPQGQFDRLLKPKEPRERKDLLIQLAGLSVYDRLNEKLSQRMRPLEEEALKLQGELQRYQDLDPGRLPLLRSELQGWQAEKEALQPRLEAASELVQRLTCDLADSRALEAARERQGMLFKKGEAMGEARRRLELSARLESFAGQLQHLDSVRTKHRKLSTELPGLAEQTRKAEMLAAEAEARLLSAREQASALPQLKREKERLLRLEGKIRAYEEARAENPAGLLDELFSKQRDLAKTIDKLNVAKEAQQKDVSALQNELASMECADVARAQTELQARQAVAESMTRAEAFERKQKEAAASFEARRKELEKLSDEHVRLVACKDELARSYQELSRELQSQTLREQLQVGCECPVCLQPVAVLPAASGARESQLKTLSKSLKSAEKDCEQSLKAVQAAELHKQSAQTQRELYTEQAVQARQDAAERERQFLEAYGSLTDVLELERRLQAARAAEKQREQLARKEKALSEKLARSETEVQVANTQMESLLGQIERQKKRVNELQRKLQDMERDLAEALGVHGEFAREARDQENALQKWILQLEEQLDRAEREASRTGTELQQLRSRLGMHETACQELRGELVGLESQLSAFLAEVGLADESTLRGSMLSSAESARLKRELEDHARSLAAVAAEIESVENRLGGRLASEPELSAATKSERELEALRDELAHKCGDWTRQVALQRGDLAESQAVRERAAQAEHRLALHKKLALMLNANGLKAYVANRLLQEILGLASAELERLSGRYQLQLREDDILVVDGWNAGETRDVRSLSGGETFLASLSLALALVEYLSQGSPLESLFIDEGFGTLDPETLESVAQTLESLQAKGRLVGVITHVQELAERLPVQIRIEKGQGVSRVVDGC